jgi:hypothetical protein
MSQKGREMSYGLRTTEMMMPTFRMRMLVPVKLRKGRLWRMKIGNWRMRIQPLR